MRYYVIKIPTYEKEIRVHNNAFPILRYVIMMALKEYDVIEVEYDEDVEEE